MPCHVLPPPMYSWEKKREGGEEGGQRGERGGREDGRDGRRQGKEGRGGRERERGRRREGEGGGEQQREEETEEWRERRTMNISHSLQFTVITLLTEAREILHILCPSAQLQNTI